MCLKLKVSTCNMHIVSPEMLSYRYILEINLIVSECNSTRKAIIIILYWFIMTWFWNTITYLIRQTIITILLLRASRHLVNWCLDEYHNKQLSQTVLRFKNANEWNRAALFIKYFFCEFLTIVFGILSIRVFWMTD